MPKKPALTALLLIALTVSALADGDTRASRLRSEGIDIFSFQPIMWAHSSRTLAGYDRPTLEEKKKGIFFRLWFLDFTVDGQLEKTRWVPLSIPNFEQASFSPDDTKVLIVSNAGTQVVSVDTTTLQVSDVMKYEKGVPGFRVQPPVMWTCNGQLLTLGHIYDSQRFADFQSIAKVDPYKTGVDAFTPVRQIFRFERSIPGIEFLIYPSDHLAFFTRKVGEESVLATWDGTDKRDIDRAPRFNGYWAETSKLFYSANRPDGTCDLIVYDALDGTSYKCASGPTPYRYLFMSGDGSTGLACQIDNVSQRMDVFVCREKDGFKAQPVPALKGTKVGWLRISEDGRYAASFTERGLAVVELP
ncbi:MAG: hypothetical protein KC910_23690 [Candidatus Eremiobacteraeota bacterium]|nr:hypothetical protein [Candidatus Eremiobacteraeota bacterium]